MKDWGIVEPVRNRWVWPLTQMDEGDFFHVDHADKHPEALRNYVSTRAAQMGRYFSVAKSSPDMRGFAKVMRVQPPHMRGPRIIEEIDFDTMIAVLNRSYRDVNPNPLPIWTADEGDTLRVNAERAKPTPQDSYVMFIPESWKSAVECDAQGFTITRVPLQTTMESFTEQRLADIMA